MSDLKKEDTTKNSHKMLDNGIITVSSSCINQQV